MGTTHGTLTQRGQSMNDAYQKAREDAEFEHGHEQGYSGAINCTYHCYNITSKYNAAKDKRKFIEDLHERMSSGDCYGVELEKPKENTNKIKTQVVVTPQKGAKKWETRFIVREKWNDGQFVASEKTQGAAIKKARAYVEKNQCTCEVEVAKVLAKGTSRVAEINYKPSKTQKDGKYLFIYAAKD